MIRRPLVAHGCGVEGLKSSSIKFSSPQIFKPTSSFKSLVLKSSSLRDLEPHAAHRASCGESSLAERAGKTDGRAPFTENHARVGRLTLDGK